MVLGSFPAPVWPQRCARCRRPTGSPSTPPMSKATAQLAAIEVTSASTTRPGSNGHGTGSSGHHRQLLPAAERKDEGHFRSIDVAARCTLLGVAADRDNGGAPGGAVNMAPRPSLVREEVKGGYAMGNHTWNHPDMAALSAVRQAAELDQMSAGQRSITGHRAVRVPAALWRLRLHHAHAGAAAPDGRVAVVGRHPGLDGGRLGLFLLVHRIIRIIRLAEQEGGALHHPIVLMHNQPIGNRRPSAPCRRSSSSSATATASSRSSFRRLGAAAAAPPGLWAAAAAPPGGALAVRRLRAGRGR